MSYTHVSDWFLAKIYMLILAYHTRPKYDDNQAYFGACCLLAIARLKFQELSGAYVVLMWTVEARMGLCSWMSVSFYWSEGDLE